MTGRAAQDFWLENLGAADRFNRWVLSRFERHLGLEVLEVGCGSGNFTVLMASRGHKVTGIDIEPAYVETAQKRVAAFPGSSASVADATASEFQARFDTVVALDVLEHIADDGAFLARLGAALKPGGKIVLKVPAGRWLHSRMDDAIGHHRRYDRAGLAETLRRAGFEPVEIGHINMPGVLGWWLNGKVLKRDNPPAEQVKLFERLVPLFRAMETLLPLPLGLSLIAVASYSPSETRKDGKQP
jgi:SAM-dependent methyltransferase